MYINGHNTAFVDGDNLVIVDGCATDAARNRQRRDQIAGAFCFLAVATSLNLMWAGAPHWVSGVGLLAILALGVALLPPQHTRLVSICPGLDAQEVEEIADGITPSDRDALLDATDSAQRNRLLYDIQDRHTPQHADGASLTPP